MKMLPQKCCCVIFLDKCLNGAKLQPEQRLDTVWYFSFSIIQAVWKLSLIQEEYLCSCYWIMNFKQISNTFPLKQQTVDFQFPRSWQCVPPSPVGLVCPVKPVCNRHMTEHFHTFHAKPLKGNFWLNVLDLKPAGAVESVVLLVVATRGQLCTGLQEAHCQIKCLWSCRKVMHTLTGRTRTKIFI